MITVGQIKAARALLGWTQVDLADRAIVSPSYVKRLETEQTDTRMSMILKLKTALEDGGIEFIPAVGGKGEGVRLATERNAQS